MPFEPVPPEESADKVALAYDRLRDGGLLLTAVGRYGRPNPMTVSWWLFGRFYHHNPVSVVAVKPIRYTFGLLEQVPEYVVSVLDSQWRDAVDFCGTRSGRDVDKFEAVGLTPAQSLHVRVPSIKEAAVNFECRQYHVQRPPHGILTPEHRERPLGEQHSIYFAEVLAIQCWQP